MLKFVGTDIVFQEFPDEVTLAVNLSNCPCRCPGCHSRYLWKDVGEPLTPQSMETLLEKQQGHITCVGFMGGDADPKAVDLLCKYLKTNHPELKTGWYTGRTTISPEIDLSRFDYIKTGPYIMHLGGLDSKKTNQKMYRIGADGAMEDITFRFWRK